MRTRSAWLGAALCAAFVGLADVGAAAGELYVDPGSRGGPCSDSRAAADVTISTPWCSVSRAAAAAPSGATVLVRAGSLPELTLSGDRRRTSTVTLRAYPGETPSLAGADITNSTHLRVEGFRVTGAVDLRDDVTGVAFVGNEFPGNRLWLDDANGPLIERNHIHDIPSTATAKIGVRVMGGSNVTIRGNRIENLVEDPIQVTEAVNVVVEDNVLQNAHPANGEHTDAIQVLGVDGLVIRGNYMRDISHGLMFTNFQPKNVTIENNVISKIEGAGMKAEGSYGMPNLRLVNNTFHETGTVNLRRAHTGGIVRNNIFPTVSELNLQPVAENNLVASTSSGVSYGARAILKPATFVDAAAGDFELAARSAGIDAGAGAGATPQDRLGRARLDDGEVANTGAGSPAFVDVGALERQGAAAAAPAPVAAPAATPTPAPEVTPAPTATPTATPFPVAPATLGADLKVSKQSNRSTPTALDGETHSGKVYVFATTSAPVVETRFWLDDATRAGAPRTVEKTAPYDFNGGAADGAAIAFDLAPLTPGKHSITLQAIADDGTSQVVTETFTVVAPTSPYAMVFSKSSSRTSPVALNGSTVSGSIYAFVPAVSGISSVKFHLDEAPDSSPFRTEDNAPWDFAGGTTTTPAAYDTRKLKNGVHKITAVVATSTGTVTVTSTFTVAN